MSKQPSNPIQDIEAQIKKLKEKQKKLIEKTEKEIGQLVMKEWGIEDPLTAKEVIKGLKEEVIKLLNSPSEQSVEKPPTGQVNENSASDNAENQNG